MVGKEQSSALCLDVYSDLRAFSDIDSKTYTYYAIFSENLNSADIPNFCKIDFENWECLAIWERRPNILIYANI